MTATFTPIPLAAPPFPTSEYERRQNKVLEAAAKANLDALVVTSHGHLRYLTGYDGMGGYFMPFPLILVPGRPPVYVVREFEVDGVRAESCIEEIYGYQNQPDFAPTCADALRRLGVAGKRVGFELGCWNLAPADVMALQGLLPDMKVVDASRVVTSVSVVKTVQEIGFMREAAAMTDLAVRTFQAGLSEGVTEQELASAIIAEVRKRGGEEVRMVSLGFGDRNKLPHTKPSKHPLKNGDPAMIEVSGTRNFYVAGCVRSAVLGRNPHAESLHALAEEGLATAVEMIKPGVTLGEVDAAVRKVVDRSGRKRLFRHRVGYQHGQPWNERGNMSIEHGAPDVFAANMTFHMPIILFGEDGLLIGCSQAILVTPNGAEVFSRTSPKLHLA